MKFTCAILLIHLAQSAPLISSSGGVLGPNPDRNRNEGVISSIPMVGPMADGVVRPFLSRVPFLGNILFGLEEGSQQAKRTSQTIQQLQKQQLQVQSQMQQQQPLKQSQAWK